MAHKWVSLTWIVTPYGLLEILEIPRGNKKLVGSERLLMSNNAK